VRGRLSLEGGRQKEGDESFKVEASEFSVTEVLILVETGEEGLEADELDEEVLAMEGSDVEVEMILFLSEVRA